MFYFHPYLGKWSNLTNIFQLGWNHQLDIFLLTISDFECRFFSCCLVTIPMLLQHRNPWKHTIDTWSWMLRKDLGESCNITWSHPKKPAFIGECPPNFIRFFNVGEFWFAWDSLMRTWICLRWLFKFTSYHGKSPSNHHLTEYFTFSKHLKQIQ